MANEASKSEAKISMGGIGREQYQEALGRHQAITSAQTSLVGAAGEGLSVAVGNTGTSNQIKDLVAQLGTETDDGQKQLIVNQLIKLWGGG